METFATLAIQFLQVCAWPIVVGLFFVVFYRQVQCLLARLGNVRVHSGSFCIDLTLNDARVGREPSDVGDPSLSADDCFSGATVPATSDPAVAVMEQWSHVSLALQARYLHRFGIERKTRSAKEQIEALREAGELTRLEANSLESMRRTRNAIVFRTGDAANISVVQAMEFSTLATRALSRLRGESKA
jgi:hypothetical protein